MGKDGESLKTIDGHKVRFNDQKPTKIIFGDEEYRLIGVIEVNISLDSRVLVFNPHLYL